MPSGLMQHSSCVTSSCQLRVQLLSHIFGQRPALHELLCVVRKEVADEVLLVVQEQLASDACSDESGNKVGSGVSRPTQVKALCN
jgi:hypothetical protein